MFRSTDESLTRALTRRAAQVTLIGALAATPLALGGRNGLGDRLGRHRPVREQRQLEHQHGQRVRRWAPVHRLDLARLRRHRASPENASREQQIQVAEKVKASQGMGAWPVCSKKAGQASGTSSRSPRPRRASPRARPARAPPRRSGRRPRSDDAGRGACCAAAAGSYTVASGDTLSDIAAAHGTTAQSIAQRSGIANPDALTPGQKITVG